ncbi:MAG: 2-oxoacid:acceptor oxidoreductase family protein [Deltaproteobacteria bacterium]|jgi:pyruvate ferredoxin oxidoreductase gamma subunit|nr:2-oxoacid:acceptor oxidoreductase family protein [Deltaproteobacteria bacterium]
MLDVRWYGRGGQGAFTAARLLGQTVSVYGNSYALASPSFGPERRGAPVWSFTKIDDQKIVDRSQPVTCKYLVVLDESLLTPSIEKCLEDDGVIILNTAVPEKYSSFSHRLVTLDATRMSLEILGRPITNVAMLGALLGVSAITSPEKTEKALEGAFSKAVCEKNKLLLRKTYEFVKGGAR